MHRALPSLNRCLAIPPILVVAFAAATSSAAELEVPAALRELLLQSTVRIRYEREEHGDTITGHGTAFGADLSRYGFPGHRCLLTAAHNVLDDAKQPYSVLKVELEEGTRTYWSRCRALVWDEELDLCIVEAGDDVPRLLKLDDGDPTAGSSLIMACSPRGVPVKLFPGVLSHKFDRGSVRYAARIPFDHGDSGGPIIEPRNGNVIGVAVAGLPKAGDLDHDIGLFVPVVAVHSFLETHRRNTPLQANTVLSVAASALSPAAKPAAAAASSKPANARNDAPAADYGEFLPPTMTASGSAPRPATISPTPAVSQGTPAAGNANLSFETPEKAPGARVHMIQKGDNLTKIAKQYDVSLDALIEANRLKDPNCILAGFKLVIP